MEVITSIEQCLLQYTRRSVKTKPNICYWNIEQYANNNPQTTVDCFFAFSYAEDMPCRPRQYRLSITMHRRLRERSYSIVGGTVGLNNGVSLKTEENVLNLSGFRKKARVDSAQRRWTLLSILFYFLVGCCYRSLSQSFGDRIHILWSVIENLDFVT